VRQSRIGGPRRLGPRTGDQESIAVDLVPGGRPQLAPLLFVQKDRFAGRAPHDHTGHPVSEPGPHIGLEGGDIDVAGIGLEGSDGGNVYA
jgi:hypothetical protein